MRKMVIVCIIIISFLLVGCQRDIDPEMLALQTQYDDYRRNEFTNEKQFFDYMNTFAYGTSHAGVHISVEYRQFGQIVSTYESFGIIIDEDETSYTAVTSSYVLSSTAFRVTIFVEDIFGVIGLGQVVAIDEALGIATIRFSKPTKSLFVASLATVMPFTDEQVVMLSNLNTIRYQTTLGRFQHLDSGYGFLTNIALDYGALGGGIFDVNQNLLGILVSIDDGRLVTYKDIATLLG